MKDLVINCSDNKPINGRTSYMAQDDLLLPWLNVLDNILLGFKLRSEQADTSKARDLIEMVGLSSCIEDLPDKLSGGMRQRVALIRTIMENRPVVLMDEPFSSLDAITRVRMQDIASELLNDQNRIIDNPRSDGSTSPWRPNFHTFRATSQICGADSTERLKTKVYD